MHVVRPDPRSSAATHSTRAPPSGAVHGLCAAATIGLAVGRAAEDVQRVVKGSPAPAPWTGDDFLTAVEAVDSTLTVERDAFAPVRLSWESDGHPRIHVGVRISADGTHASAAPFAHAAATYYPGSPELPGILMGVSANSGDDAPDGDASDDGRSGRSTPPDDDDHRLAAYAAIYELVVSSPSTPRATIGWMNRMEYHLTRYHDATRRRG